MKASFWRRYRIAIIAAVAAAFAALATADILRLLM